MKIKCPACNTVLNVPDHAAGKVVKCPCGKQLRAPASTGTGGRGVPSASVGAGAGVSAAGTASRARPAAPSPSEFDPGLLDELTDRDLQPIGATSNSPGRSNPYAAPSDVGSRSLGDAKIASKGARFVGALVDGVFFGIAAGVGIGLVMALGAVNGGNESSSIGIMMVAGSLVPILIATIVNAVLITKSGQTVGKKAAKTKIVMRETQTLPGFVQGWLVRSFVFYIAGQVIPFFALVDVGFIFSADARTLHDRASGTIVVEA